MAAQAPESVRAAVLEEPGLDLEELGPAEAYILQMRERLLPRGQRIKTPGAGHNVHQTQPEVALKAAVSFLALA